MVLGIIILETVYCEIVSHFISCSLNENNCPPIYLTSSSGFPFVFEGRTDIRPRSRVQNATRFNVNNPDLRCEVVI